MCRWESEVGSYVIYMDEKNVLVMSCGLVGVRYIWLISYFG